MRAPALKISKARRFAAGLFAVGSVGDEFAALVDGILRPESRTFQGQGSTALRALFEGVDGIGWSRPGYEGRCGRRLSSFPCTILRYSALDRNPRPRSPSRAHPAVVGRKPPFGLGAANPRTAS